MHAVLRRAALVALAAVTCAGAEGYLPAQELPDGVALLPPPPAAGSPELARDEQISAAAQALRGTPRWALAASDADLSWPHAAGTFSCALGAPVSEAETPHLVLLLRRTLQDASRATRPAKARWARPRPFAVNGQPICVPGDRASLAGNGSYPSGHATAGWTWALVLGELAPERAEALEARGRAIGESRVVCNVHWYSDLVAGRTLAAELVTRLRRAPAFRADLAAARAELLAVRARGLAPTRDCARETAELSTPLPVPAPAPTP